MKKAKRALALALVFALVASFCVTGAAAAPGDGPDVVYGSYDQYGNWEQTQGGNGTYYDTNTGVTVSKTAEATGDNTYQVTLEVVTPVTTSTTSASAATVLVIDRSLSMGYCEECGAGNWHKQWCGYRDEGWNVQNDQTRLYAAQQAACDFLDNYRDETSTAQRYVAVVAFAGRADTVVDWVNVNNDWSLEDAKEEINDLSLASSTNLNAGLEEAEGLLDDNDIRNVPSDNCYVIALTDGSPTSETADAISTAGDIKNDRNDPATIYTVCFGASREDVSFRWNNHWYDISVSEYLSNYIATQPSLGSNEQFAFDADDADALYDAFDQLTQSITEGLEGLTVTDPMAEGVTLETEFRGNSGVDITGGDIEWTLSNPDRDGQAETDTYTLTYTVTVDPDAFEGQEAGYYPLNGETYLTIPGEHGQSTTVQFPVPGVWVTPTVRENNVYVYVQLVGESGNKLTGDDLAKAIQQVKDAGLTTINENGYFTIGVLEKVKIAEPTQDDTVPNAYSQYSDAIAEKWGNIERYKPNEAFELSADELEGSYLHAAMGADTAADDEPYVDGGTRTWHLDVPVTIDEFIQKTVTVTYKDGVDGSVFDDQVYHVLVGTATPIFDPDNDGEAETPEREGYTFTGWSPALKETVSEHGDIYTAQWSRNADEVYIKVYLDGADNDVTEQYATYLNNLTTTGTTTGSGEIKYENGHVVVPYTYDDINAADVKFGVNSGYVLQGVSGEFVYGSNGWDGITNSAGTWTVDNVDGKTTLNIYLNTAYKVAYSVPSFADAPEDNNTYITVEGVETASAPSFDSVTDPNQGVTGSWKNPDATIKTEITLAGLPTGTTGWTDEANGTQATGAPLDVKDHLSLDADNDHTFTFTATAVSYTVTYTDGVYGEEVFADQTYDGLTYGTTTPGFEVSEGTTGNPTRPGYTFTGWEPEVAETVTETVTYEAQWEEITGALTVTKTVMADEGTVTLPDDFKITVAGPNGYSKELTLNDADEGTTYTWTIPGLSLGEYAVTETNYEVDGYLCNGAGPETVTISNDEGASVTLNNSYTAISRELAVEKSVVSVGGVAVTEAVPEAKVGDTIIYKIVVTNNSNVALTGISVTDTLGGESLTVYTDAACETEATAFDLAVDETKALYAMYTVEKADAGSTLTNTATAEAEDGTEGGDDVPVEVKKQYTLTVNHRYDTQDGEVFEKGTETLNEGDEWSATAKADVKHDGVNYIFDASLSTSPLSGTISDEDVVVNLVYVKDELDDEDDTEEGGDDIPDYKQAVIKYVAEDGGEVSPTIEVVTLTDDDGDGKYSGEVKAESTATANTGYVFESWAGNDYSPEVQTNVLSHTFTAWGGETYTYTAHFRAGTTSASVDKQLVSYERDGETVSEIPEGFKALVGDVLNYEISVENTGEVALNTTVTDSITGEGTLTINAGEGYTVEDGVITINDLEPEGTVTITASYTVVAADAGTTITNTATADLPGDEPGDDPTGEEEITVDEYGITVTPADITIYMGGDAGYEAVVGENGQVISDNNSLPTPLFTVELSESFGELSVEQIEAIVIAGTTSDEGMRGWRFDYAGETEDGEDLYYIVPDEGQDPIRVTYTNDADEEVVSDHFDPAAIDELFAEFAIELYTGTVTSVTAEVNGITCEIDYSGKGKLTVRAVDDTDENPVVGVQVALPRPVEAGEGAVTAPAGTTYALNETTVEADAAGVGLLFDGIIDDGADRTGALLAELESELGVTVEDGNYQAQYLDLVDAHNGNAWVKASGAVTVYWGYPEGTGEDTDFALYHFEGLHREGANSGFDIEDVATSDIERVTITKTANGIAFDISSGGFSPFVLVWDDGDGGDEPWWPPIGPGDDDDDGDDGGDGEFVPKWLNIDDHYAYIIGYEDGTVRPQGNITRAEVATIFFRLLTDEVRAEYWSTVSGYTDVKAGDWYNNAISTLSDLGIITGYEDGTFRPNASISRAEFVTIATRFFDYAAEYEGAFSDVSYSSWYADFVQAAVDMGLVNGYENGTFRPNASITRAEAVAIVNRVLLRRPDAEHLLSWAVMNTFSDNADTAAWYYADIQEATNSHDYDWITYSGERIEDWTEKLEERDWAALEREWSKAYDAPGGEVTA